MPELETVKDLETECTCNVCGRYMVGMDELKALAIKWAKEYHLSPFGTFCTFNNITYEDLI